MTHLLGHVIVSEYLKAPVLAILVNARIDFVEVLSDLV